MSRMKEKKTASEELTKKMQDVVDKWFAGNLHNSVVSRDTDVHNLLHASKPALVQALVDAMEQTPSE